MGGVHSSCARVVFVASFPTDTCGVSSDGYYCFLLGSGVASRGVRGTLGHTLRGNTGEGPSDTVVGSNDVGRVVDRHSVLCLRATRTGGVLVRLRGNGRVAVRADLDGCRTRVPVCFFEYRRDCVIGLGGVTACRPCGLILSGNTRVPIPPGGCKGVVGRCGTCLLAGWVTTEKNYFFKTSS